MIDLSHWNLTIPEQTPAQVIHTQQVATYRSQYFTPSGTVIRFWVPVTGTTTRGAKYPRSELRETFADGKERNWLYPQGASYLRASLAVQQVPSSGKLVIGQIHAEESPYPLLKIQYRQDRGIGHLDLTLRGKPKDAKSPIVMTYKGLPLERRFDYAVDLSRGGELKVDLNGKRYQGRVDSAWAKHKLYFKAGVYVLDNQGPPSEGGKAEFYVLEVGHGR